jgi:hypothetical protein
VETLLGADHFAHLAEQAPAKFEDKFTSSSGLLNYEDREHDVCFWHQADIN